MKSRKTPFSSNKAILYILLSILAVLVLYPLIFAFLSSFKTVEDYTQNKMGPPALWSFGNYAKVLVTMRMLQYTGNTVFVVAVAMAFYMIICTAAGYAFGKLKFHGRLPLFAFVLFLQIFPQMVVASELYMLLSRMHLVNTYAGVIISWLAYFTPFGTYIMTTYYASVSRALIESARIDGANVFEQLFLIMIPIAKPMLGTIGIVGALAMWNELPFSMLILQKSNMRTLTLGIALMQGEFGLPIPVLCSAVMISAIIPLVAYLILQDFITMGATAGSVKG
ncbi:MAG: carbohydrate ABC transporter permease [Treponema sp.]|jgi:ABC-type glycerol-3-phosphate transport system permease component|nr:carbohydrate ABC transporter permease [Treponema sp.]